MELKDQIPPQEVAQLLQDRKDGKVDFLLVDVREQYEYDDCHIVGTDHLIPTSSFLFDIRKLQECKDDNIILYCRASNRSLVYQMIMKDMGFKNVSNMSVGIIGYTGERT